MNWNKLAKDQEAWMMERGTTLWGYADHYKTTIRTILEVYTADLTELFRLKHEGNHDTAFNEARAVSFLQEKGFTVSFPFDVRSIHNDVHEVHVKLLGGHMAVVWVNDAGFLHVNLKMYKPVVEQLTHDDLLNICIALGQRGGTYDQLLNKVERLLSAERNALYADEVKKIYDSI